MAPSDRLVWLRRLRATKASPKLMELMAEKGWINMEGTKEEIPPWEELPDHPASPKPKRDRNEYFREYMRKYRERKKGTIPIITETKDE